jgi:peptidoglycan-associated lipoprotein
MKTVSLLLIAVSCLLSACSSSDDEAGSATGAGGPGGGAMGSAIAGAPLGSALATTTTAQKQELTQQVGDTIHFGYDSSTVGQEDRGILERQAAYMQKYPNLTFTIEGHCDERGTREYNLALGERRANATKAVLVALGVSDQRLQTISYGKERPVVAGSVESSWAQNRRAVTVIN